MQNIDEILPVILHSAILKRPPFFCFLRQRPAFWCVTLFLIALRVCKRNWAKTFFFLEIIGGAYTDVEIVLARGHNVPSRISCWQQDFGKKSCICNKLRYFHYPIFDTGSRFFKKKNQNGICRYFRYYTNDLQMNPLHQN